jgi:hypothetical protein
MSWSRTAANAAGQLILGHDLTQRIGDAGRRLGACCGKCDEKEDGTESRDAH